MKHYTPALGQKINLSPFLMATLAVCCIHSENLMSEEKKQFYAEEEGSWFEHPVQPKRIIESQNIFELISNGSPPEANFVRPKSWPIRAAYIAIPGELFEFDNLGNIIYDGDGPVERDQSGTPQITMSQVFVKNFPLWKGSIVFSRTEELDIKEKNPTRATYPYGFVKGKNNRYCPLRPASEGKVLNTTRFELDGDCDDAFSFTINGTKYFTYPSFRGIKEPYFYWKIQYFNEPKSPFPSPGEGCRLYCED
jgi:hypothetical protein